MRDNEWTHFLGWTAEGEAVYAHVRVERTSEGRTVTFTDHTQTDGPIPRLEIMWTVARIGRTAPQYATGGGRSMSEPYFDGRFTGGGQVPPENRVVTKPALDPDTIAFIEQAWGEHHLNDMQAACDHMRPGVDYEEPAAEDLPPSIYGEQQARQHWRLDNVVCAAGSGYRYGHDWLAHRIPDDTWARLTDIAHGKTDTPQED